MTVRLGNARPAVLALTLLLVCCCGLAAAADRIDRGFGQNGKVDMPVPEGGVVSDLALAPNGEMVAAVGSFSREGSLFATAKLRADGLPVRSFGQGGKVILDLGEGAQAQGVTTQPDGRILIAGSRSPQGVTAPMLARLRPDGSLDPGFGDGGLVQPKPRFARRDVLYDVAVQRRGRIVAVGARNEDKFGTSAAIVVAYRPDGSIDRSFGAGGEVALWGTHRGIAYTGLRDVVALPNGKLLASGYRRGNLMLVRLNRDGSFDRGFGSGGIAMASIERNGACVAPCIIGSSVEVESGGRIVVLATNRSVGSTFAVARFTQGGRLDRSFAGDGIFLAPTKLSNAFDLALQPGGGIVVAGRAFRPWSKVPRSEYSFAAVRLTAGGRLDRTFGKGVETLPLGLNSVALAALTQPGRGVVVAGGVQAYSPAVGYSLLLTRFTR